MVPAVCESSRMTADVCPSTDTIVIDPSEFGVIIGVAQFQIGFAIQAEQDRTIGVDAVGIKPQAQRQLRWLSELIIQFDIIVTIEADGLIDNAGRHGFGFGVAGRAINVERAVIGAVVIGVDTVDNGGTVGVIIECVMGQHAGFGTGLNGVLSGQ